MAKGIHILRMGVVSLIVGALGASDGRAADDIDAVRQVLLGFRSQGEMPLTAAADMLVMTLRQVDGDGNGLDQRDLDFAVNRTSAQRRAGFATNRLLNDLDGDGRVSRDEVETVLARGAGYYGASTSSQRLREKVDEAMRDDTDGDGFISGVELVSVPASRIRDRTDDRIIDLAQAILAADPNHDGIVTQAESFAIMAKVLSQPGQAPVVDAQSGVLGQPATTVGSCPPLQFDKNSALVLVGAHEGRAISNVSVVGQDDVTSVATIRIEPGPTPITLVLTSYDALIWEMTGETSRIAKVFATSVQSDPQTGTPAVGVVGVDRGKVEFVFPRECFKFFHDPRSPQALTARAQVERLAGRGLSALIGQYGIDVISVPSDEGKSRPAPPSRMSDESLPPAFVSGPLGVTAQRLPSSELAVGAGSMFREFQRFSPGGLKQFRVESVVGATKPEYYEVLPQQAGLMQLLQSGALKMASNAQGEYRLIFTIQSPTRFPPGLNGAHSVKFFVPKGVPMPKGSPGHSCVYVEQAGSYTGATCR